MWDFRSSGLVSAEKQTLLHLLLPGRHRTTVLNPHLEIFFSKVPVPLDTEFENVGQASVVKHSSKFK